MKLSFTEVKYLVQFVGEKMNVLGLIFVTHKIFYKTQPKKKCKFELK